MLVFCICDCKESYMCVTIMRIEFICIAFLRMKGKAYWEQLELNVLTLLLTASREKEKENNYLISC